MAKRPVLLSCRESNLGRIATNLVTMLTELPRFLTKLYHVSKGRVQCDYVPFARVYSDTDNKMFHGPSEQETRECYMANDAEIKKRLSSKN
jgi:hypothetical protein